MRAVGLLIIGITITGYGRRLPLSSERKASNSRYTNDITTSSNSLADSEQLRNDDVNLNSLATFLALFQRGGGRSRGGSSFQNNEIINDGSEPSWLLDKHGNGLFQKNVGADAAPNLVLDAAAAVIPHPEKANRKYKLPPHCGGEDAYFVDNAAGVLGVADGVGGWADEGVDPGIFSRQLMTFAAEEVRIGAREPKEILKSAHAQTTVLGSSTALIVTLDSTGKDGAQVLKAANMGDSGFLHLRRGRVLFESESQQHYFNAPFQLGAPGTYANGDSPDLAEAIERRDLRVGDVLVLGSDGLLDNLFPEEIAAIVFDGRTRRPQDLAKDIAQQAHIAAKRKYGSSPFATEAAKAGYRFQGGKLDDITVIVAVLER